MSQVNDPDIVILNELYTYIYNNINNIKEKYSEALDPTHNNTTLKYIDEGYTVDEAMTLSFMITLLFYIQLNDEKDIKKMT